jgi:DNA polymerase III alpha subunit
MINLKVRTEYSFRRAYGPIGKVIKACNSDMVAITDNNTWGHVPFSKSCKKPIYGVEIAFVEDCTERKKQPINYITFLAKNNKGLQEIYNLNSESLKKEHFYYVPRLDYTHLFDVSENVIIFSGPNPNWGLLPKHNKNVFAEISPISDKGCLQRKFPLIATSDNYYPAVADKSVYQVLVGQNRTDRTKPMHILNEWEYKDAVAWAPAEAIDNTHVVANMCRATLKQATMVKFDKKKTLLQLCKEGAKKLQINLKEKEYQQRLMYEFIIREVYRCQQS